MQHILCLLPSLVSCGRWHAFLFRRLRGGNASMCWALSMRWPTSSSWWQTMLISQQKVSAACSINWAIWNLVFQSPSFWTTLVTSAVLWWLGKRPVWRLSYVFCQRILQTWTWLSACGSLSKNNVCIPGTILILRLSKLPSIDVLRILRPHTELLWTLCLLSIFSFFKKRNSHPCKV